MGNFIERAHVEVARRFDRFRSGALMKTLHGMAVGTVSLLATGVALAQNGNMMNGSSSGAGWMSGYGGYGIGGPILLIVVIALVVWIVQRKGR